MTDTPGTPQAPSSRGKNREVWVGLLVILGLAAVLTTLFTMTDASTFRGRYVVVTHVSDAVGIRKGDPVLMRGVNIGRVQRFFMAREGVDIRLEVEGEYRIPSDSRVELGSLGLLGGMAAKVVPGQATSFLRDEDTLPGGYEAGIMQKADDLAAEADKTLKRVQALLSDKTVAGVESSAQQLSGLLQELSATTSEQRRELKALVASLRATAGQVEKATAGPELERSLKRIDTLTAKAEATVSSLERSTKSLETITGRVERGEGTLGKLSQDETLYTNLNKTVENLNGASTDLRELLQDLRKNPKRYVKLSLF
jgi:phospholipid/cholesterol/gamma-HCH transport system substrate-binding protein